MTIAQAAFPNRNFIHMLNQSQARGHGISSSPPPDALMYTLIKNPASHFCRLPHINRWLTATECLLAQGFPIRAEFVNPRLGMPHAASESRACSFAPGGSVTPAPRKRNQVIGQAGNSQNLHCVTVVWLYILIWAQFRTVFDLDDASRTAGAWLRALARP